MPKDDVIHYIVNDSVELNLSYMPFISDGGLFIPTFESYALGDVVEVDLQLPNKVEPLRIVGKVIWVTPKNALHQVLPGIGIQFTGANAPIVRSDIELMLDPSMEIGGYTYGMIEEVKIDKG